MSSSWVLVITVLIAEQDLQTSREQLIEVQREVSLAMVRLQRAVGGAGVVPLCATVTV